MSRRSVFLLALFLLSVGSARADEPYFSSRMLGQTSDEHDFFAAWFSKHLVAMNEPTLSATKVRVETYRILWLRTFHAPMVFRMIVLPDGRSALFTKKTNGLGGYEPGNLVLETETEVSQEVTKWLLENLERANFWLLPSADPNDSGFDGSEWIVEGVKDGNYHVIARWIGQGITDWALPIMKQSGEDLQPIY